MSTFTNQSQITVTAVQMNSQQNIKNNMITATNAIKEAKQKGSSLVVLPENVASMGKQKLTAEFYEELRQQFSDIARKYEIYLVAGTLPCKYRPDGSKVTNGKLRQVSLLFAPDGTQIARYDKIHLFKALVNDNHGSYDESSIFEAGTDLTIAHIELNGHSYALGLMVCFDLRFPKMAQSLRQFGAEILTAPSAFTYQTGKKNWSLLLKARALDSQCLVVGAGQGGEHTYDNGCTTLAQSTRHTWGHSGIACCDGTMLAEYNDHLLNSSSKNMEYELINAEFDSQFQQNQRNCLPIFNCHRLV